MQRFETKYDLLNAAYKDSGLKKGTIALLQYLVHKSNKEQCFPAVETIAKALNVCKRTVQYNMRKLEKAGYIIRKDRWYNHQQLTNQYVFNLGIVEDVPGVHRYSDAEKAEINSFFLNISDKQADAKDEICQDKINKAIEILKIYNMPLSSREKLLLIYLFHRADQKGMVYDMPEMYMSAIGVGCATFMKLLKKLRTKNLIKVKYMEVSGRNLILIKLTGNLWKEDKVSAAYDAHMIQQNSQKAVSDQNTGRTGKKKMCHKCTDKQEMKNNRQIVKYKVIPDKERGDRSKKKQQWHRMSSWRQILKKYRNVIQSGIEKIRIILRL